VLVSWNGGSEPPFVQDVPEKGTIFRITSSKPNVAGSDAFTFTAPAPKKDDVALGKDMLKDIKVVPNPYFAKSIYEHDQFNRVLKFNHLPRKCTIRVFNLAGDLVTTINKDDENSYYNWIMHNDDSIPVASGIYIWFVESEFGEAHGKMAIFREEERLDIY
jgi:hypothetical protein